MWNNLQMNCYPRIWVMKLCYRYFPSCILHCCPPHQPPMHWIDAFNSHSRIFATTLFLVHHQPICCDKEGTYVPPLQIIHAKEKPRCHLWIPFTLNKGYACALASKLLNAFKDRLNLENNRPLKGRLAHPCKSLYIAASVRELELARKSVN